MYKEVLTPVLILKHVGKRLAIDNKDPIKILLDLIPLNLPQLPINCLLNFNIGLSHILQSTGPTDTLGSLNLIPSDHPDFDIGAFQGLDGLLEVLLQFILDAGDTKELDVTLKLGHKGLDLVLVDL